jgi:hypothetical protein
MPKVHDNDEERAARLERLMEEYREKGAAIAPHVNPPGRKTRTAPANARPKYQSRPKKRA